MIEQYLSADGNRYDGADIDELEELCKKLGEFWYLDDYVAGLERAISELKTARAALATPPAQEGDGGERVTEGWRPISEAPMDGTVIQLLQGGEVFAGFAGDDPDHPWKFLDRKGRDAFVNAFHHKFSPRWWRPLGVPVREAALRAAQEGTGNDG